MSIRLSHTAKELYLRCPLAYYMHYMLGYREERVGSPLPFGSAVDEGTNVLLNGKTLEEAIKKFNQVWEMPNINGEHVVGSETDKIKFSKADSKEHLAETPWECLKIKGEMLISAYQEEIMPSIKDVLFIQKPIHIKNDQGDYIVGFADVGVELHDGKRYIMDNKTSSKSYPKDAVTVGDKAKQIALYYEDLKEKWKLDGGGFYVMEKGIRKNEPRTRIQTLTDKIPEHMSKLTFDEFDEVLYSIRMGQFPSNHPTCNTYYGNCICNLYAPSGGADTTGLIKTKGKR